MGARPPRCERPASGAWECSLRAAARSAGVLNKARPALVRASRSLWRSLRPALDSSAEEDDVGGLTVGDLIDPLLLALSGLGLLAGFQEGASLAVGRDGRRPIKGGLVFECGERRLDLIHPRADGVDLVKLLGESKP